MTSRKFCKEDIDMKKTFIIPEISEFELNCEDAVMASADIFGAKFKSQNFVLIDSTTVDKNFWVDMDAWI